MEPGVTAIVVTYESAHALPECLAAIGLAGIPAIVVDNASEDVSPEIARLAGATLLRNACNEGYGRANNRGVEAADSEFVLIVNPDVILELGSVAALVRTARRHPDAGIVAPKIVEPDGRVFFQPRSLLSPYLKNPRGELAIPEGEACVPFVSGACFLIRRALFLGVGGFDPAIFLFYEDDDLCRKVADNGFSIIYCPAASVRHGRGKSSAPAPGRVFRSRWHQAWSRAYVSRKYGLPDPAPLMAAINGIKAAGARAIRRTDLYERYGGSAAGAFAWMRGRTALEQEGLRGVSAKEAKR